MTRLLNSILAVTLSMLTAGSMARAGVPEKLAPGSKAPDFTLSDVQGKKYSLDESVKKGYVVVMFIATQCPVSNRYNERMTRLYSDYASKGLTFLAINSNKQESLEEVRDHAKTHGFQFPVLKDYENHVADAYGAQVTPEIYVIDGKGILRYHGRIDDSMYPDEVTSQDLRAALDALLTGKEVPRAETKAFGCSIKRVKAES